MKDLEKLDRAVYERGLQAAKENPELLESIRSALFKAAESTRVSRKSVRLSDTLELYFENAVEVCQKVWSKGKQLAEDVREEGCALLSPGLEQALVGARGRGDDAPRSAEEGARKFSALFAGDEERCFGHVEYSPSEDLDGGFDHVSILLCEDRLLKSPIPSVGFKIRVLGADGKVEDEKELDPADDFRYERLPYARFEFELSADGPEGEPGYYRCVMRMGKA